MITIDGGGGVWLRFFEQGRRFQLPSWLGSFVGRRPCPSAR